MFDCAAGHRGKLVAGYLWLAAMGGCAPKPLPDPRATAEAWLRAVRSRDAKSAHALLDQTSRREYGLRGVAELLERHHPELTTVAAAAVSPRARSNVEARVRYRDGRVARVQIEDGRHGVAAFGVLPARATDPRDALAELRAVLARRSFAGLLRVLTHDTARALSLEVEEVVTALEDTAAIAIEVDGRRAVAHLPGGRRVILEREDGVWRVKDFE